MKIGIIGSGGIGLAFARQASKAGYEIVISNSRGASTLVEIVKELGGRSKAGSFQEAVQADVLFLAVQWIHLPAVARQLDSWAGKIVIDPINPVAPPDFKMVDLGGSTSSEVVRDLLKGARIVKAFNTFTPELLAAPPSQAGGKRVIFYSGDDHDAKRVVRSIIDRIGFAGIDLGNLAEGGKLQQYPSGPLPGLNLIQLS